MAEGGHQKGEFLCECGTIKELRISKVVNAEVRSCGCLRDESNKRTKWIKHGHSTNRGESKAYCSWRAMINRCNNPNDSRYYDYGGRGIKVCERWASFLLFLEDMGDRPDKTTLDRIDNSVGYGPGNCRWATSMEQSANKRRRKDAKHE